VTPPPTIITKDREQRNGSHVATARDALVVTAKDTSTMS
jgi:hypothetical protein